MARFLREVPPEVAEQILVNKTVNASQLDAVKDEPMPEVDLTKLESLARHVPAPELMPWEYAYVDLFTDGERFFITLEEQYYRKSDAKRLNPVS